MANVDTAAISMHATPQRDVMLRCAGTSTLRLLEQNHKTCIAITITETKTETSQACFVICPSPRTLSNNLKDQEYTGVTGQKQQKRKNSGVKPPRFTATVCGVCLLCGCRWFKRGVAPGAGGSPRWQRPAPWVGGCWRGGAGAVGCRRLPIVPRCHQRYTLLAVAAAGQHKQIKSQVFVRETFHSIAPFVKL